MGHFLMFSACAIRKIVNRFLFRRKGRFETIESMQIVWIEIWFENKTAYLQGGTKIETTTLITYYIFLNSTRENTYFFLFFDQFL